MYLPPWIDRMYLPPMCYDRPSARKHLSAFWAVGTLIFSRLKYIGLLRFNRGVSVVTTCLPSADTQKTEQAKRYGLALGHIRCFGGPERGASADMLIRTHARGE